MDDKMVNMTKRWSDYKEKSNLELFIGHRVELIAEVFDDDGLCYRSELLGTHHKHLESNNLNDAKYEVENLIASHYKEKVVQLKHRLDLFDSGVYN